MVNNTCIIIKWYIMKSKHGSDKKLETYVYILTENLNFK